VSDTKRTIITMFQLFSKLNENSLNNKITFITAAGIVVGSIDEDMKDAYTESLEQIIDEHKLSVNHLNYVTLKDAVLYPSGLSGEQINSASITLFIDQIVGVIPGQP